MKVLHLAAGGLEGGAARGSYWLHRGLLDLGVESFLLNTGRTPVPDGTVDSLALTSWAKAKAAMSARVAELPKALYRKRKPWIFNTGIAGMAFTRHPAYQDADIVHLHWINSLVSVRALGRITKPVVWTLRDMWPLTGGCHYSMGCERYREECGHCPQLGSSSQLDLSRLVSKHKSRSLPANIRIVGISSWLSECARESSVFQGADVRTISNNIDTTKFFPIEQVAAREVLGLPREKKIIAVGAKSVEHFYKGFSHFIKAARIIGRDDVEILLFGRSIGEEVHQLSQKVREVGLLADIISLRLAYSAADVFVAPSRMDAFGKTLAESMACGTPAVCFDATGPADIVEHQVTGYKAQPFDSTDLAQGIDWVLSRENSESQRLRQASRDRAVRLFDSRVIAKQYVQLYEEILG